MLSSNLILKPHVRVHVGGDVCPCFTSAHMCIGRARGPEKNALPRLVPSGWVEHAYMRESLFRERP